MVFMDSCFFSLGPSLSSSGLFVLLSPMFAINKVVYHLLLVSEEDLVSPKGGCGLWSSGTEDNIKIQNVLRKYILHHTFF